MNLNLAITIQANLKRRKNSYLVVTFQKKRKKHGKRIIARFFLNMIFFARR